MKLKKYEELYISYAWVTSISRSSPTHHQSVTNPSPVRHQSTSGKRGTKIHLKAASQKGTRIAKSSIKQGVPGAFAGNCLPGGYPKIIGQKLPYMGTWFMSLMWLAFAIALASPLTFFWPLYSLRDRFLEHLLALSRPG